MRKAGKAGASRVAGCAARTLPEPRKRVGPGGSDPACRGEAKARAVAQNTPETGEMHMATGDQDTVRGSPVEHRGARLRGQTAVDVKTRHHIGQRGLQIGVQHRVGKQQKLAVTAVDMDDRMARRMSRRQLEREPRRHLGARGNRAQAVGVGYERALGQGEHALCLIRGLGHHARITPEAMIDVGNRQFGIGEAGRATAEQTADMVGVGVGGDDQVDVLRRNAGGGQGRGEAAEAGAEHLHLAKARIDQDGTVVRLQQVGGGRHRQCFPCNPGGTEGCVDGGLLGAVKQVLRQRDHPVEDRREAVSAKRRVEHGRGALCNVGCSHGGACGGKAKRGGGRYGATKAGEAKGAAGHSCGHGFLIHDYFGYRYFVYDLFAYDLIVVNPFFPFPFRRRIRFDMTDDRDHFARRLCFNVYTVNRAFGRFYQAIAGDSGLTYLKLVILNTLKNDGALSISELSARAGVEPNTLSPLLKKMARVGVLTRERASDDERRVLIEITEKGRRLLARADALVQQGFAELGLDQAEADRAVRFLQDVRDRLDKADPPRLEIDPRELAGD
jgi:MarR family transcriptional regulator, organic hydroperoxide resistance regulator